MARKGLFELFFVLIMLVLLFPVATQKTNITTSTIVSQTENLALLTDFAIADAISDYAFDNCSISGTPTNRVDSYLSNLIKEFNMISGTTCNVSNSGNLLNISRHSADYNGYARIICKSTSSIQNTSITKELFYLKNISIQETAGHCRIQIRDSYQANQIIVDYNLSTA